MPSMIGTTRSEVLNGQICLQNDQELCHLALILATLTIGTSTIRNLPNSNDLQATIDCCRNLGAHITFEDKDCTINGVGVGGLCASETIIEVRKSSLPIFIGLLSSHPIQCFLQGGIAERQIFLQSIITPMMAVGATFDLTFDQFLPARTQGAYQAMPISFVVTSAEEKTAILLAALNCAGTTTVVEENPSHTDVENLMSQFGLDIFTSENAQKHKMTLINGHQELSPCDCAIPADTDLAIYMIVAAAIVPDSKLVLHDVKTSAALVYVLAILRDMGAKFTYNANESLSGFENINITIEYSPLSASNVQLSPIFQQYNYILAVAASSATGTTGFESSEYDFTTMIHMLEAAGINIKSDKGFIEIQGNTNHTGGGIVTIGHDVPLALSSLILGCICDDGLLIDDQSPVTDIYPEFISQMQSIGCMISS